MIINPGDVIKHKNFLDTAIQVMSISKNPDTQEIVINGIWLNQGYNESFVITENKYPFGPITIEMFLSKLQLEDWLKCKSPISTCIRNEEWEKLQ